MLMDRKALVNALSVKEEVVLQKSFSEAVSIFKPQTKTELSNPEAQLGPRPDA